MGTELPTPRGRAVLAQTWMEMKLMARSGESLLVTLGIPLGILVFFGRVDVLPTGGVDAVVFLVPGVLAISVMSTAMVQLAIQTAFERKYAVLKRLGGTPLTRGMFLASKGLAVAGVLVIQTALVLVVAVVGLGWQPSGAALSVALAMVVGAATFTAIGMLIAGTVSAELTLAGVNGLYLVLLLISGMMVSRDALPAALATAGAALPSGALTSALRAALGAEATVAWGSVGVLAAWGAVAAGAAVSTFRWEP